MRTIYLLVVTTYRIWSVSALPGRHQKQPWMNFAKGRLQQRLLQAMTGVSQILPSYAVLFGCMLFKWLFLICSWWIALNQRHAHDIWRKVYRMVQAANGDVSFVHWSRPSFSIGLSELFFFFFRLQVATIFQNAFPDRQLLEGCSLDLKRTDTKGNTFSIAREIYCTKKINQIRSFSGEHGEHGFYLNIQRAVILYWMNPVMAKCH